MTEMQTKPLTACSSGQDKSITSGPLRQGRAAPGQARVHQPGGVQQDLKAIRARLAVGLASPMQLKNVTLSKDEESTEPDRVWPSPAGYRIDAHRLGFGSIHALFICRQQGFLPNDSDDALWQELKQERFTTPLLRGWLPHVRKELEIKSLLTRCHTLDCTCCILTATSADLDSIVEFGLQNGFIKIEQGAQT